MAVEDLYPSTTQSLHCDGGSQFSVLSYGPLSYSLVPHYGTDPKSTEALLWLQHFLDQADRPSTAASGSLMAGLSELFSKESSEENGQKHLEARAECYGRDWQWAFKKHHEVESNSSLKWFRNPLQGDAWLKIIPSLAQ